MHLTLARLPASLIQETLELEAELGSQSADVADDAFTEFRNSTPNEMVAKHVGDTNRYREPATENVVALFPEHTGFNATVSGSSSYERSLLDARLSLPSRILDLPWERGILQQRSIPSALLHSIFTRPELPSIERYLVSSAKELQLERERTVKHTTFPGAVRRIRDLTPTESIDVTRRKACMMWLHIISISPESSATGRIMCDMVAHLKTDNEMLELVDRILAKKAAGTMYKRASSFMRFVLVCKKNGKTAVPLSENVANEYCESLMHTKGVGSTTISSFIQAVNFMGFTLQFDNFRTISLSGRIKGAADKMALKNKFCFAKRSLHRRRHCLDDEACLQ